MIGPGKLIIRQAFDKRALVAVMIDALERLSCCSVRQDATIYAVGSTMEEIGVRGARAALHHIKPDMFIGLDINVCADTTDSELRDFPTRVGRDP